MTDHCLEESRGLSGGTPQGLPACPPPSAECLERSRGGLSLNHLKAVAVAAMVIDHIAFAFVPDGTLLAILLHSIGKITGPTMFFAAVEGCHHTRNLNRYLLRLAVFALVSWFPFLYFHFGGDLAAIQLMRPNVIYTIFLGVLAVRIRRSPRLCSAWKVLLILLLFILSVPADWGYTGVVIILVFDYYYGSWKHQAFAYCMVVMLDMGVLSLLIHPFFGLFYDHVFQIDWELYAYSVEYVGAFLPLLLLSRYTGRHGTSGGFSKWFFYMFYPPPPAGPGLAPGRAVSLGPHDPQGPGPAGDESSACCRNFHHPPGQRQQKEKERTCSGRSAPSARSATGQQLQESQKAQRPDQIGACTDRRAEGHCTGARPSGLFF